MAFQNNLVENMVNAQKKAFETITENTKKYTGDNNLLNDTIEKGNEWYKNWLESQKALFDKTTGKAAAATETVKENTSKMSEFYENWLKTQMNWAKQMWEMNQEAAKSFTSANTNSNPFTAWQNSMNNWSNPMGNWMNNMPNMNWMNNMQNPMDAFKSTNDTWTNICNQYYSMMNNNFSQWQKNMENSTVQDAYKNMVNIGEGFTKFAEMWTPMFKSIQDKTFNMDMYKQFMNPETYKDLMDKYFGFLPESSRQYMNNMSAMMNDGMKQMSGAGMNGYQQMRSMMNNNGFNGAQAFGEIYNAYNTWNKMMADAAAPFTKLMGANKEVKAMEEWNDISNRIMVYNIKNAELQYMIYNHGSKVMDALAENVAAKVKDGKEVTSMLSLYQEWLNISDKVYVSLFESNEYSELMSEVSALQMKLKKDIELQMEKMMTGIPVATRSEMDELYKAIYDLKKQVRQMEKMMEFEETEETETEAPKSAKKTAKK
jgi:hypothetical protein